MIIKKFVFPIKADLTYVSGAIPIGKLTANSLNKDMFYVISPTVGNTVISANFQNNLQTSGVEKITLIPSSVGVDELVSKNASYYELVKDWNVWESFLPSKPFEYVAYNRAGLIGISFYFRQYLIPQIPYGVEYRGKITDDLFIPSLDGAYVIDLPFYQYDIQDFMYHDLLIKDGEEVSRIKALVQGGATPTIEYSVDPSVYEAGYEEVEIDLTESILSKIGELNEDKQDKLIAGENITIEDNVISAVGGSSGGYEPDNITIGLNTEQKLEVKDNLEIDGGFL